MQLTRRMVNNDMTFGYSLANFAVDAESVAQNVVTRLRTFKGEWFLDTDFGVAWFQSILVKPSNIPLSEALIKAMIIATDGVDQIKSFSLTVNSAKRIASLSVSLTTIYGTTENIQVNL